MRSVCCEPSRQTARPFTSISKGVRCACCSPDGWPAWVVVDSDAWKANAYFDGLVDAEAGRAVLDRVQAMVERHLREATKPPSGTLATEWVVHHEGALHMAGWFWLNERFPKEPRVILESTQRHEVTLRCLQAVGVQVSTEIPVEGHLRIVGDTAGSLNEVMSKLALEAIDRMLGRLDDDLLAVQSYRWSLCLLGETSGELLFARTTEGTTVSQHEVMDELSRGTVWWSAKSATDSLGAVRRFPGEPPPFILDGTVPNAVITVLAARAPGVLAELGEAIVEEEEAAPASSKETMAIDVDALPRPSPAASPFVQESVEEEEPLPLVDSWLDGLTRRVVSLFTELPPPAPVTHELADAVAQQLTRLGLGETVVSLVFSRSGRPVRFEPKRHRLVINRDHPAVRRLLPSTATEPSREALGAIAAAVASELNLRLTHVTAAEEKHVLFRLLAQLKPTR